MIQCNSKLQFFNLWKIIVVYFSKTTWSVFVVLLVKSETVCNVWFRHTIYSINKTLIKKKNKWSFFIFQNRTTTKKKIMNSYQQNVVDFSTKRPTTQLRQQVTVSSTYLKKKMWFQSHISSCYSQFMFSCHFYITRFRRSIC